MEVSNKTKRPLRVPLPGGKKLHLGPSMTAKLTPKAAQFPPLLKMVEAGDIEILDGSRSGGGGVGGGNTGVSSSQSKSGGGSLRHTGDR